eukprot:475372_1
MDLKCFIEKYQVYNVDNIKSTTVIDQVILRKTLNDKSYITSKECKQISILVKFKSPVHLHYIACYPPSLVNDELKQFPDFSGPKDIHIHKINDLNINMDNLLVVKSDMKFTCSQMKYEFLVRDNATFTKIQYIAVHIKSNQANTTYTFINAVQFLGHIDYINLLKISNINAYNALQDKTVHNDKSSAVDILLQVLVHTPKLIKILKNVMNHPENEKYTNLNLLRVSKLFAKSYITMENLYGAGFEICNDGKRLLYNHKRFDTLKKVYKHLYDTFGMDTKADNTMIEEINARKSENSKNDNYKAKSASKCMELERFSYYMLRDQMNIDNEPIATKSLTSNDVMEFVSKSVLFDDMENAKKHLGNYYNKYEIEWKKK